MKRINKGSLPVFSLCLGLTLLLPFLIDKAIIENNLIPNTIGYLLLGLSIAAPQIAYFLILSASRRQATLLPCENPLPSHETSLEVEPKLEIPSVFEKQTEPPEADLDAIRAMLIRPVFKELCSSIEHSLSSTTEPISNELLGIKKTITTFLNSIKSYEGEVVGRTTIVRIEKESIGFKDDLETLAHTVEDVFSILDEQFGQLKSVSDRIEEIAANIASVSANIHVLSINASIEAARAGEVGKGFRVIASEVKVLSSKTAKHLEEINTTMLKTRSIFENIGLCLNENRVKVVQVVDKRQEKFSELSSTLNVYFERFEELYSGVGVVISALSRSMDSIAPVIQLHEITSQEIGNLQLVADDFAGYLARKTVAVPTEVEVVEQAKKLASEVRRRLTTEREILALKKGLEVKVQNLNFDFGINNNDIELF